MTVTSSSDARPSVLWRRLRPRPGEWRDVTGCALLALLYVAAVVVFAAIDTPVERTFFAQRRALRIHLVQHHPLAVGQAVDAVTGGAVTDRIALLDGWSGPEAWGVWSDGRHASLAVALPPGLHGRFRLDLTCVVMLDAAGEQVVDVAVDGGAARHFDLRRRAAVLSLDLDAVDTARERAVAVDLAIGHPVVPTGGHDGRALGLGLRSVELSPEP